MDWTQPLIVGAGGFVGANARFWLGGWLNIRSQGFPWGTLVVNVAGCLAIGVLWELSIRQEWPAGWRLFLGVGLLGGFTTYSAFANETVEMLAKREWGAGIAYGLATPVLCVGAAWLGRVLLKAVIPG